MIYFKRFGKPPCFCYFYILHLKKLKVILWQKSLQLNQARNQKEMTVKMTEDITLIQKLNQSIQLCRFTNRKRLLKRNNLWQYSAVADL